MIRRRGRTRFVRGRGGRRLPFRRRGVKPTFDVIPIYNTPVNGCQMHIGQACGTTDNPSSCDDVPGTEDATQCCVSVASEELISNETVEDKYNDKMKVVRLVGWVKFHAMPWFGQLGAFEQWPYFCRDLSNNPAMQNFSAYYSQMVSMGIHVFRRSQAGAIDEFSTSLVDTDLSSPLSSYPWTEGKWIWQRHKYWAPTIRAGVQNVSIGSMMGCCPDVSGGATFNPLAEGTGNINTSVSTECNKCLADNTELACAAQWPYAEASLPPWQTFAVRLRRPVVLDGDESLRLQIGLTHPRTLTAQVNSQGGWGCSPARNSIADLGQEKTYFGYHMKLLAVIQHNY